jgi:hypothetical protein
LNVRSSQVTNTTIEINDDLLRYDDDTLGLIRIASDIGFDTFNIQSTDVDNPIVLDGEEDLDVFNISSDADGNNASLDGILGDI